MTAAVLSCAPALMKFPSRDCPQHYSVTPLRGAMNAGRSQTLLFLWRVGKNYSDILMLRDTQTDVRLRFSKLAPDRYFQQCGTDCRYCVMARSTAVDAPALPRRDGDRPLTCRRCLRAWDSD